LKERGGGTIHQGAELKQDNWEVKKMRTAAIILAAGSSERMGRPKLTMPYGDSNVLDTVIRTLQSCRIEGVTVVLGHNWEQVYDTIEKEDVEIFVNPRPEGGMLSSAQWALAQLRNDVEAILFALGDQPEITPSVVEALITKAERSEKGIFIPTYEGRRGHPVLFRERYKQEILDLPRTVGLNAIAHAHPEDVEEVSVDTPAVLLDIDTPEDYRQAIQRMQQGEACL
jgi:molybdenum cofactor cytidylyltransferase